MFTSCKNCKRELNAIEHNIKLVYWIAHHRGKFRLYTNTSTRTINKIVITDCFAQYYIYPYPTMYSDKFNQKLDIK